MKITRKLILGLEPCENRLDNYLRHYGRKTFDILDFLDLPNITHSDKLWVALRLLPRELVEVFAIDCAMSAQLAATANAATYTADANAYAAAAAYARSAASAAYCAANAAYYAGGARTKEENNQILAIKYLISSYEK